ncbi:MAG: protein BatD [Desulfobacterales bacterium]|nr:protein BatD [Desulfobacterales bacterium]
MGNLKFKFVFLFIFLMGAANPSYLFADVNVAANIEPDQIFLDSSAVLNLTVNGAQSATPQIPNIQGLKFTPAGQSTQFQSINGVISLSVSYRFIVRPEKPGDYKIHPISVNVNGEKIEAEALSLKVMSSSRSGSVQPSIPNPKVNQPKTKIQDDDTNQIAFLRLMPNKSEVYIGELVSVTVKAFFVEGLQATINSLPKLSGDSFTFNAITPEPAQTVEIVNGRRMTVLTWNTAMSPIKEGKHKVNAQIDATFLLPDNSFRRNSMNGFFDDDFFNSFFGRYRRKDASVVCPDIEISALALPDRGKPEDFNGAVGEFSIYASASPTKVNVGDPITLQIVVNGTGNFDRVVCPQLSDKKGFKTYAPSSTYESIDISGHNGKRQFEQAIIPENWTIKEIPPLVFSYFNTKKGDYVSLKTDAIPVEIINDAPNVSAGAIPSNPKGTQKLDKAENKSLSNDGEKNNESKGIASIHIELGNTVDKLSPYIVNPMFWSLNIIPLFGLVFGVLLIGRHNKIINNPELLVKQEAKRKISGYIKAMDKAIHTGDVLEFFKYARKSLQERLGEIWGLQPDAITIHDLKVRLNEGSLNIIKVFEGFDAASYSGFSLTKEEMQKYKEIVISEIKNLEKSYVK